MGPGIRRTLPRRVLSKVDRAALAAYCQAYGRWMEAERALTAMKSNAFGGMLLKTGNGSVMVNPVLKVAERAMNDMVKIAAEFGMTPSARSRIEAAPKLQENDPLAKFLV